MNSKVGPSLTLAIHHNLVNRKNYDGLEITDTNQVPQFGIPARRKSRLPSHLKVMLRGGRKHTSTILQNRLYGHLFQGQKKKRRSKRLLLKFKRRESKLLSKELQKIEENPELKKSKFSPREPSPGRDYKKTASFNKESTKDRNTRRHLEHVLSLTTNQMMTQLGKVQKKVETFSKVASVLK